MKKLISIISIASIVLFSSSVSTFACSWAEYSDGKYSVTARTMDWYDDTLEIQGYGRGLTLSTSDTDGGIMYTTEYASIGLFSMETAVGETMNEKGLSASFLLLEDSYYPDPTPEKIDVSPINALTYFVSTCATVQEVSDQFDRINIIPYYIESFVSTGLTGDVVDIHMVPLHYAFSDENGDNLIVEFIDGEIRKYHGKEHNVLTNDPNYEIMSYLTDVMHYKAHNTIETWDRFAASKQYLADMEYRNVSGQNNIVLAMRGLLAQMNDGTDETDKSYGNTVYPTVWGVIGDKTSRTYYVSYYNKWHTEIYDFDSFDVDKAEMVILTPKFSHPDITENGIVLLDEKVNPVSMGIGIIIGIATCVIIFAVIQISRAVRKK